MELDVVETNAAGVGTGAPNLGVNSLEVVATFRPGERVDGADDTVSFLERRERDDNLEAQLREQTFVMCGGESSAGDEVERSPTPTSGAEQVDDATPAPAVAPSTR